MYFMMSSLFLFTKYKNVNVSKTKEDIPQRKVPFFFILKSLSKRQQLFLTLYKLFNVQYVLLISILCCFLVKELVFACMESAQ